MSPPTLFPEIIDLVLSNVEHVCHPSESKSALKACSLVNSEWQHMSQKHLFKFIIIDAYEERHFNFVRSIALEDPNATRLAEYIRFVRLADALPFCRTRSLLSSVYRPMFHEIQNLFSPSDSIPIAECIVSFLNKLHLLRGLSVGLKMTWNDIGPGANKALLRLSRLPSLEVIELSFLEGVPISLLPLFGANIRTVCVEGWSGLSSQSALEPAPECDGAQAGCGPTPEILKVSGSSDLELLMSPRFRDVNPTFFSSLRFVAAPADPGQWGTTIHHFYTLLETCPRLSKFTIGNCEGVRPYGLEFVLDYIPSTQNLSGIGRPRYRAMLSTWIHSYRNSYWDDCQTLSEIAMELVQKPLSLSFPYQPSSTLPTNLSSSTTAPVTHYLSDVLASLTLNYHVLSLPEEFEEDDPIRISQPYSNMWTLMDEFLAKNSKVLKMLSVNINVCIPGLGKRDRDFMRRISSLISKADDPFPWMRGQLGKAKGGKSGFERTVSLVPSSRV